jgi:hypothetical protein
MTNRVTRSLEKIEHWAFVDEEQTDRLSIKQTNNVMERTYPSKIAIAPKH